MAGRALVRLGRVFVWIGPLWIGAPGDGWFLFGRARSVAVACGMFRPGRDWKVTAVRGTERAERPVW